MNSNKKIFFLPIKVADSFPNLVVLSAWGCSLTKISKENIKDLRKLTFYTLTGNKIENIPSDAFEGLTSLEWLWLDSNGLKSLDSNAFNGLTKLKEVRLTGNVCLNENFDTAGKIATLSSVASAKCGYQETTIDSQKCPVQEESLNKTLAEKLSCEANLLTKDSKLEENSIKIEQCEQEKTLLEQENIRLESDLKSAECKSPMNLLRELADKIDNIHNQTGKIQEIQDKIAENNNKDAKIKQLEEQNKKIGEQLKSLQEHMLATDC